MIAEIFNRHFLMTLALGTAGGAVFFALQLPLAWMLGSMCATTVAALAGADLRSSLPLRNLMIIALGAMLGSAFTPDVFDRVSEWFTGFAVMLVFVAVTTGLVFLYFRATLNADPATCYFSATPGGLGEMTIVGEEMGGDSRVIPLAHATRILVIVFSIPFFLRFVDGLDLPATAGFPPDRPLTDTREFLLLALCGGAGFAVFRLLKIPGGRIMGPMLVCGALYATGVIEGRPPTPIVAAAQVVIGATVGARFVGFELRAVGRVALVSASAGFMMFAAALLFSRLLAPVIGLKPEALLLALAPGGLAEMSLIALALHVDTAFVACMHLIRIMLIVSLAPVLFRWWKGRSGGTPPTTT